MLCYSLNWMSDEAKASLQCDGSEDHGGLLVGSGLRGRQSVSRLIPVGVHPGTQGNCCGPSGADFNHNSSIYKRTHTHTKYIKLFN